MVIEAGKILVPVMWVLTGHFPFANDLFTLPWQTAELEHECDIDRTFSSMTYWFGTKIRCSSSIKDLKPTVMAMLQNTLIVKACFWPVTSPSLECSPPVNWSLTTPHPPTSEPGSTPPAADSCPRPISSASTALGLHAKFGCCLRDIWKFIYFLVWFWELECPIFNEIFPCVLPLLSPFRCLTQSIVQFTGRVANTSRSVREL